MSNEKVRVGIEGDDDDDDDASISTAVLANELFVERMQTISIRKHSNKPTAAAISAANRRKSVHQIACSSSANESAKRESTFWNYDELNELKMKFLSLLSSSDSSKPKPATIETNRYSMNTEPIYSSSSSSNHSSNPSPTQFISTEDYSKIESFYKSFGTQLHVTNNFASLYTLTLNDANDSKSTLETMINLFMLNDDYLISKQQWTVCHRGIPLWLFNTGANPRRPYRQLKFTLAEKGTGFILWQDRIDVRSDFKIFRKRKDPAAMPSTTTTQQQSSLYSLYQENLNDAASQSSASTLILTFKASDRKTLVFVKFDIYQEVLKFFSYYLKIHNRLCEEIRQRTKSLPIGVGSEIMTKNSIISKKSTLKKQQQQQQQNTDVSNICIIKYKRISKNDISLPSNSKHLINIKSNERGLYYTLSKLLPEKQQHKPSTTTSLSPSQSPSSSLSTSSSINDTIDNNTNNRYSMMSSPIDYNNNNKKKNGFLFISPSSTTSSTSSTTNNYNKQLKTIK